MRMSELEKSRTLEFVYVMISKVYYNLPYFKGSTRLFRILFKWLPLRFGPIKHSLGFKWYIHSRESLWTFLVSCEKMTTKQLILELEDAETFICVGANFGWYPLVSSSINSNVKVFGFECNSTVRSHFERNVAQNKYQISVIAFAINDQESELDLFLPKSGNDGMSTLYPMHGLSREVEFVEKVNCTTLDAYFGNNFSDFGKTVILMDIEGSEMRALLGGIRLFAELNPVLICEVNTEMLESSGYNHLELFERLASVGYKAFWIDERGVLVEVKEPKELPHTLILPRGTGANYLFKKY